MAMNRGGGNNQRGFFSFCNTIQAGNIVIVAYNGLAQLVHRLHTLHR